MLKCRRSYKSGDVEGLNTRVVSDSIYFTYTYIHTFSEVIAAEVNELFYPFLNYRIVKMEWLTLDTFLVLIQETVGTVDWNGAKFSMMLCIIWDPGILNLWEAPRILSAQPALWKWTTMSVLLQLIFGERFFCKSKYYNIHITLLLLLTSTTHINARIT